MHTLSKLTRILLTEDENSVNSLDIHILKLNAIVEKHKNIVENIEELLYECRNRHAEILELNSLKKKGETSFCFVFQGKNKVMAWGDMHDIELKREKLLDNADFIAENFNKLNVETKEITTLDKLSLKAPIAMQKITNLSSLPCALHWYIGDSINKEGVYIRLHNNMIVRVPMPDLIDGTKNYTRDKTIKCKYETLGKCYEVRKQLSQKYEAPIRECLFAHLGDSFVKVGSSFRCPANPRFGDHRHLETDMENMTVEDIKPILMYSLSDVLLTYIWKEKNADNIILNDINICK